MIESSVSIIIPTFNRQHSLAICLASLVPQLESGDRVVVVDAGSQDGTGEFLARQYPGVTRVLGSPNDWWAALINLGLVSALKSTPAWILTLNDDTDLLPGALSGLRESAGENPGWILASVCCHAADPHRVFFAGRMRSGYTDRFHYSNLNSERRQLPTGLREVDLLHGMCTLYPASLFSVVGVFDAKVFPHLFADDDLVLRAIKAGYRCGVVMDSVVLNDRSKTGMNPYDRRLTLRQAAELLTSRRSAFQVTTRTRFLWRHRRSVLHFVMTWSVDYLRLCAVILLRWGLSDARFQRLGAWRARWLRQQ